MTTILAFTFQNIHWLLSLLLAAVIVSRRLSTNQLVGPIIALTSFFFLLALVLSLWQYQAWQADPIMRFVIPPYQPMAYLLGYLYHAFWKRILWRVIGASIIMATMAILHIFFKRSLFKREEFALVPSLALLIDFPLSLAILPTGLLFLSSQHLNNKSQTDKLSALMYWPIISFALIIIGVLLSWQAWFIPFQP